MKSNCVIVTGASGYIGGQTILRLGDAGHNVIGIDIRPAPDHLKSACNRFYQEDFANEFALSLLDQFEPRAIIHCAGTSLVGPSVTNPERYYDNNFVKTKRMLDRLIKHEIKSRVIFSSSAAVYGEPVMTPCSELDPPLPVSPYGESKLMIEMALNSYSRAYGLDYVSFRYFNACGADPRARHGQANAATHIIARVLESMRDGKEFVLNGENYPTQDGTCVRDYIHVDDLARAHEMAIEPEIPAGVYNLGSSSGYSNREIMDLAQKVADKSLKFSAGPQREGDPAVLTAASDKFNLVSAWVPRYNIEEIIQHAWAWYTR
jgi:UDP-glucose 4-epimerase